MGLERGVYAKMGGDMVPLCASCAAVDPLASETEVVCRFTADVVVAEMVVESLWVCVGLCAGFPLAFVLGRGRRVDGL
jgi:hypothetical protein